MWNLYGSWSKLTISLKGNNYKCIMWHSALGHFGVKIQYNNYFKFYYQGWQNNYPILLLKSGNIQ